MARLLIVDDSPAMGMGIKLILEKSGFKADFESCPKQGINRLEEHLYDIIILDINMADDRGINLAKTIKELHKKSKVIIYTSYEVEAYFNLAMEIGSYGIISKTSSVEKLICAIECALHGEVMIPLHLARKFKMGNFSVNYQNTKVTFSQREQDILQELQRGSSNQEIANKIHFSRRSVEQYLTRVYRKLEVKNRLEAVSKAVELGYLSK
ncbi:response regulator [Metabacillus fastidiosus]|uniref:response regulator n=1 Tax=Metabacillus fastidiosus TaxID=1458 RepID=UPI003D2E3065